jgi:hypothetical protein
MRRNQLANGHFGTEWRPSSYFRAADVLPHGYLPQSTRLAWVNRGGRTAAVVDRILTMRGPPGDLGNTQSFSLVARFEPQGPAH